VILPKYNEVVIDASRWPHISANEICCRETYWQGGRLHSRPCSYCGGEYYHAPEFLDKVQAARYEARAPFYFNSGHRCGRRNALIGGAIYSAHRKIAVDISLRNHDRHFLLDCLKRAGLTTFGFYKNFIHTDPRPDRRWVASKAARLAWSR